MEVRFFTVKDFIDYMGGDAIFGLNSAAVESIKDYVAKTIHEIYPNYLEFPPGDWHVRISDY